MLIKKNKLVFIRSVSKMTTCRYHDTKSAITSVETNSC